MIWFISDTHFSHRNIIKYSNRPFKDVDEMNETLILNWNRHIQPDHIVYHLGDFSFQREEDKMNSLFWRLNGKKHLIIGNHDSEITKNLAWESVQDYCELSVHNKKFVLMHYPLESWNRAHHGAIHLYGHVHTQKHHPSAHRPIPKKRGRWDVGVDQNDYCPVNIWDAIKRAENND